MTPVRTFATSPDDTPPSSNNRCTTTGVRRSLRWRACRACRPASTGLSMHSRLIWHAGDRNGWGVARGGSRCCASRGARPLSTIATRRCADHRRSAAPGATPLPPHSRSALPSPPTPPYDQVAFSPGETGQELLPSGVFELQGAVQEVPVGGPLRNGTYFAPGNNEARAPEGSPQACARDAPICRGRRHPRSVDRAVRI